MDIVGIKLQNSLGRVGDSPQQTDLDMGGMMSVARVLKVHHKTGTADVKLVNSNNEHASSELKEGRFSARILQRSSNFDTQTGDYWGSYDPIAVGSLVLVGYLDGIKARPIILGCFHNPDNAENILPEDYPLNEKTVGYQRREALKTLRVFPNRTYKRVDGEGNLEMTFGDKSFLSVVHTGSDVMGNMNDKSGGFDFEDLSEKDKRTGFTLETPFEESKTSTKLLYVHRDFEGKSYTKVFIDHDGKLRISRDNKDGALSFLEINADGEIRVKRQNDSSEIDDTKNYTEVVLDKSGEIHATSKNNDEQTTVNLKNDNLEFDTTGNVNINAKKEINIVGCRVNIIETKACE